MSASVYRAPDRPGEPDVDATPERELLEQYLDFYRGALLAKCDGLTKAQLSQRSIASSSMSLLGLVRHMTLVEQWWFQRVFSGNEAPLPYADDTDPDFEWHALESASMDEVFSAFTVVVAWVRATVAVHALDDIARGVDSASKRPSLRWVYVHMIEEYARHLGHADLLRELIDGAVGY